MSFTRSLLRQPFGSSEEFLVKAITSCFHVTVRTTQVFNKVTYLIKRSNSKMGIGYNRAEMSCAYSETALFICLPKRYIFRLISHICRISNKDT